MHKKNKAGKDSRLSPGALPQDIDIPSTSELYYKKLGAYLLLLYQSYLREETVLEPEIKMALWRMIQLDEEFRTKIQMSHLDYLGNSTKNLNASWEVVRATLFPKEELLAIKSLNDEKTKLIKEYKDAVTVLLTLNP